jgi:hypothetical protein
MIYLMSYLLKGKLPWKSVEPIQLILSKKIATKPSELFSGFPV